MGFYAAIVIGAVVLKTLITTGMAPANFITTEFIDGEFLVKAREKEIGVLAMKPLGGGRVDNAPGFPR